jgi:RHS repeat-associated protein
MVFEETNRNKQAFKFGGKELDMMNGLNWYDFVARGYDPVTGRFLTIDPLAEKYPWISPYAYCGNNPVNRIDPTGMIWEKTSLEEINNLKKNLDIQREVYNSKIKEHQNALKDVNLSDVGVAEYTNEILVFKDMVSNLETSINDIDRLGNDPNHTYILNSNKNTNNGYVSKGRDGNVSIVGDGWGLTVHEITHVRQSLDAGKLNFDTKTYRLQYAGPGVEVQIKAEVEAYQKQFSVKRTDYHPGFGLRGPGDITPQVVGNMKRPDGSWVYPDIHNYLNKFLK